MSARSHRCNRRLLLTVRLIVIIVAATAATARAYTPMTRRSKQQRWFLSFLPTESNE